MTDATTTQVAAPVGTPIPEEMFTSGKIPEKFRGKNFEDVALSYTESEKAKTRAEQDRQRLEQENSEYERTLQERQEAQRSSGYPQDLDEDKFAQKFGLDPEFVRAQNALFQKSIKQYVDPFVETFAVNMGATRLENARRNPKMPDFEQLETEVRQEIAKTPELSRRPDGLEVAYKIVKSNKMGDIEEKARKYDELLNQQKVDAQVMGGGSSGTTTTVDTSKMSSAEFKKFYADKIAQGY